MGLTITRSGASRIAGHESLINGHWRKLEIPIEELEKSPDWTFQSASDPPLSVGEASQAAITEFKRYMSDSDDWVLHEIALRSHSTACRLRKDRSAGR